MQIFWKYFKSSRNFAMKCQSHAKSSTPTKHVRNNSMLSKLKKVNKKWWKYTAKVTERTELNVERERKKTRNNINNKIINIVFVARHRERCTQKDLIRGIHYDDLTILRGWLWWAVRGKVWKRGHDICYFSSRSGKQHNTPRDRHPPHRSSPRRDTHPTSPHPIEERTRCDKRVHGKVSFRIC